MDTTRTAAMHEPKAVLSMVAFIRDPVLWLVAAGGSVLGLALPQDLASAGHGAILGGLALLGGFFGKVLQVWLQFRQQTAKESEDRDMRFERLLREEREAHEREQGRLQTRIESLEKQLDRSRRDEK